MHQLKKPTILLLAVLLVGILGVAGYQTTQKPSVFVSEAMVGVNGAQLIDESVAGASDEDEKSVEYAEPDDTAQEEEAKEETEQAEEAESAKEEDEGEAVAAVGMAGPASEMLSAQSNQEKSEPEAETAETADSPAETLNVPSDSDVESPREKPQTYEVTLIVGNEAEVMVLEAGETMAVPQEPTLAGNQFLHWYDASGDKESAYAFGSAVERNLTLVALFEQKEPIAEPAASDTADAELEPDGTVTIWASVGPEDTVSYGDIITFYGKVEGYSGVSYHLQWQASTENEEWVNIEGENGLSLSIVLSQSNYLTQYRLKVVVE